MSAAQILVLGGSGFVGRHLVARLVTDGWRVVVPTRQREKAKHLILLPTVDVLEADVHDPRALAQLVAGSTAAVNLVGILNESRRGDFERVHVDLPHKLVDACVAGRVGRLLHMSALQADRDGPSRYLRSKGDAEALIERSGLAWTIFRPSVIFGHEDRFLNLFARIERLLPVVALAGAGARFQPVYVGDVATALVRALGDDRTHRQGYSLCGPKVYTLRELFAYVGELTGYRRPILPLGATLGALQASLMEWLPGKLMSRDNLASMRVDSVCDSAFPFGLHPTALEAVAPDYLTPAARRDRFSSLRSQVVR